MNDQFAMDEWSHTPLPAGFEVPFTGLERKILYVSVAISQMYVCLVGVPYEV
jgi:hypothetical protein